MERELKLFRFVDGINDEPFPNKEVNDEQIVLNTFTYNASRMSATPTITASINYPRCLDNDWDIKVYAEYRGEKYYIRQIPSSSKDNKSIMYKHELTLYSERFLLENIYLYDVDKNDDTNVIIRCNLHEFVNVINLSLEKSNLPYRVRVDESVPNDTETKDISLNNVYLSVALQEIYNQWNIPYYFEGTSIIVKDCSTHIIDTIVEYGQDNSLISIKKENANFRKITRISGVGGDKNIPFYYPNWSQKGVIDATPLSDNTILKKGMIVIEDMDKFDKFVPINGKIQYKVKDETLPIYKGEIEHTLIDSLPLGVLASNGNAQIKSTKFSFESVRNYGFVEMSFIVNVIDTFDFGWLGNPYNTKVTTNIGDSGWDWKNVAENVMFDLSFDGSYYASKDKEKDNALLSFVEGDKSWSVSATPTRRGYDNNPYTWRITAQKTYKVTLTGLTPTSGEYDVVLIVTSNVNENVQEEKLLGDILFKNYKAPFLSTTKQIYAQVSSNYKRRIELGSINFKYSVQDGEKGWYLNSTKKLNDLSKIGIRINATIDDTWENEGFYQEVISKIPTSPNLMPTIYRDSLGKEKFYNAINDAYRDENGEFYEFETEWSEVNQNEHIQSFPDVYPSITNMKNADGLAMDEILEVAFDDNDNNEVDEEGKYLHPYFYIRIPKYDGAFGFNLFDHKIVGENMQVSITSGDCAACNFEIMVRTRQNFDNPSYEDVLNPIVTYTDGSIIEGDWQSKTNGNFSNYDSSQQDSRSESIWLALKKDNATFNETYPNSIGGVVPKVGDKFVLLNIKMPKVYVLQAEQELRSLMIQYMYENNSDKWNFQVDFSRIFLQENPQFTELLSENVKLRVRYNGIIYDFYANTFTYDVKSNEALPKISIGLVDTITVNQGIAQQISQGVMKDVHKFLSDSTMSQVDFENYFLRKRVDEAMPNNMTFEKSVTIKEKLDVQSIKTTQIKSLNYNENDGSNGSGFKLEEDENGESIIVADVVKARKKIEATEFVIKQIQFQGGIVVQSNAQMECLSVEEHGEYYRCYFNTKNGSVSNEFEVNDLARCQKVGYQAKYYWRKVVGVGSNYIDLSKAICDSYSDAPSANDIIVQFGNTDNKDRQSIIVMSTIGENAPSFVMYQDVKDFTLDAKDVTGIVYHKRQEFEVENEDGSVETIAKEAYPEVYSYGAMYFGDRGREDNYIQFQPTGVDGAYELIVKAKAVFNSIFQDGSTIVDGGVIVTNVLNVGNGGVNGLDNTDKPRFWAGSSYEDSNKAPFRVYDDGRVFAGVFHGAQGAFVINADNFYDVCSAHDDEGYVWNIHFERTGSYVYIDDLSSRVGGISFRLPDDISYVGMSIEIINPYGYMISNCSDIPQLEFCTLNNYEDTVAQPVGASTATKLPIESGVVSSISADGLFVYYYRWSIVPNECSAMIQSYIKFKAIVAKVESNTLIHMTKSAYPQNLFKWMKKGSYELFSESGDDIYYKTTSECLFMRWIIEYDSLSTRRE